MPPETGTARHLGTCGYAVCTSGRSGSNLLCQYLASTGFLGHPLEYFDATARRMFGFPGYPDEPDKQIVSECARWEAYFARNGIAPPTIWYEDMLVDAQGAVDKVAALFGLA